MRRLLQLMRQLTRMKTDKSGLRSGIYTDDQIGQGGREVGWLELTCAPTLDGLCKCRIRAKTYVYILSPMRQVRQDQARSGQGEQERGKNTDRKHM
jgi:hypothetical protein